jgi:class 3 adenylate cyclase/tetratricopeptide (TPR) repeat protein/DNA-binding winged helix-turn-helix (wHTH) protein
MEYRVLGPLEVLAAGGEKLALGGAMQRSVLASLLLRRGQTVARDRLIDDLWDKPPETAARTVQVYVSRLRHQLPSGAIESHPGGYRLVVDGAELDLEMFEQRAQEGHTALAAGDYQQAAALLRGALALWRGPALVGLNSQALRREAQRLEEFRLSVLEDRTEADLGCGRHGELVSELTAVVNEHPFRERPRAQLMRALYHSGRPGDALALYRDGRRMLVEELGLEPGQELRELEQAILRQAAELKVPEPKRSRVIGEPVPSPEPEPPRWQAPPREVRKTVTILFCDVVDSTGQAEAADPEVVRSRLARFFEQMKTIVERHGGAVEKFIGDAVMAVFGVPRAHEDDALRACRAAIEMRNALPTLGIEGRIGLVTGEVVTGTQERLATGDAVNVAARLEQAAQAGEILIGEETLRLTRDAVEVEPVAPLALKGKLRPVPAFRLLAANQQPERPPAAPMVGRESELERLSAAFDLAVGRRSCELFTIVGEPGVGKSRLVREFLSGLPAMVAAGRCPPYGEGITYWPVVEALKQLGTRPPEPEAAAAVASLLGESETVAPAEEIAWAFRRTLETAAGEQPLVVVFDDIQWGERTFLDLVEHVALLAAGVPLLLLCMARPELTERRSGWPVALRLEPLAADAVQRLLPNQLDDELRARIERAAGGNPLFVEEMVAMAAEARGDVTVPATLRSLLAARLDQLDPDERRILEFAAVEGELFHRGAIRALAGGDVEVTPRLAALVRRQLIQPDRALVTGDDGFSFRHLLIRDAAYEALTKSERAESHERLANWLNEEGKGLVEFDELVGYHLEQAVRYRDELGLAAEALAERAGSHLAAAGRRAFWRVDEPAAASLLERALELTRPFRLDVDLELDLADVFQIGDPERRSALAEAAADRAAAAGDRAGEAQARVAALESRAWLGSADVDEVERLAQAAVPLLEQAGDHAGLARVWSTLAFGVANGRGRYQDMMKASEQADQHAKLAGRPDAGLGFSTLALVEGPTPAGEALQLLTSRQKNPSPPEALFRAVLLGMLGRFDEAWPLALGANERLRELRGDARGWWLGTIAAFAGDHETAVRYYRRALEFHESTGNTGAVSGVAPLLARELCALGRYDEAAPLAERGRRAAAEWDVWGQVEWRRAQAVIDAAAGRQADAERLAREAVAIAERTDALGYQGDALSDLAEVLLSSGQRKEAVAVLEQALDRYERKENLVMAERVRTRLAEMKLSDSAEEPA